MTRTRMRWTGFPFAVALAVVPSVVRADHFVITATEKSKEAAQKNAADSGGWVLDTNLYPGLARNRYAVVRGPFAKSGDAQRALDTMRRGYPAAYVKDAGQIRIGALFGGNSTPVVAAALLGELAVTLTEEPGSRNGCEPQEPYVFVELSFMTVERTEDNKGVSVRRKIDVGALTISKRSGEIKHMRACWE